MKGLSLDIYPSPSVVYFLLVYCLLSHRLVRFQCRSANSKPTTPRTIIVRQMIFGVSKRSPKNTTPATETIAVPAAAQIYLKVSL